MIGAMAIFKERIEGRWIEDEVADGHSDECGLGVWLETNNDKHNAPDSKTALALVQTAHHSLMFQNTGRESKLEYMNALWECCVKRPGQMACVRINPHRDGEGLS